jgi:F-type H+-transporting ATPase subunit delta
MIYFNYPKSVYLKYREKINKTVIKVLDSGNYVKSKELNNFLKLIVENGRIELIPDIANELNKIISKKKKSYKGIVYSDSDIDSKVLGDLEKGLGKKFDSKISLSFNKGDFDGIKVDVEDLGIEISFSKSRINNQIVEHILKAI